MWPASCAPMWRWLRPTHRTPHWVRWTHRTPHWVRWTHRTPHWVRWTHRTPHWVRWTHRTPHWGAFRAAVDEPRTRDTRSPAGRQHGAGRQPALLRFPRDLTVRNRRGQRADGVFGAVDRLEQREPLQLGDGGGPPPPQFRLQRPPQRQQLRREGDVDQRALGVTRVAVPDARELVHRPQLVLER